MTGRPADRWRHRRAMAWLAFVASLVYPALLLAGAGRDLVDLAWPFYTFTSATVGAYIGFATVDDRWQRAPAMDERGQGRAYEPLGG